MDTKLVGLVGAISALIPFGAARGMPVAAEKGDSPARSFAELLAPIPNAVEKLKASDAVLVEREANAAKVELARYYHHHHHHHHFLRPFFHHHHHHHHHFRPRFHHHHHHHHHHFR